MIKKIVSFSVEHPISVICIILAIFITGIFCALFMNTDLLPQLSCRKLIVATEFEGMSSEDMRLLVTIPLEDSFSSLKGLKNISSVSRDNISIICLELHWGTDCDIALVECRELIDICYQTLPSGCDKPVVKTDYGLKDTMTIAMIPKDKDMLLARHVADIDIKPRIQRINGCGNVKIYGGEKEEISVTIQHDKLLSTGLTLDDIASNIAMTNVEYPAGTITEKDTDLIIKTYGLFESLEDIKKLPIAYNQNKIISLESFASVSKGKEEIETFFLFNGNPSIRIGIIKKNDASPIILSKSIKKLIKDLENQYSDSYSFVILEDLSSQVADSLFSLIISAVVGIIITFLVIVYFLKSLNVALLLSSVIPLCASLCFVSLNLAGCTLNIMSLSGIAVGIGMVVDAGAVALENLERKKLKTSSITKNEIVECVMEIAMSNTGSAITSIIVFIPVFFLEGILGEVFFDMAVSIVCAITTSCLLSLTYIPALYSIIPDKSLHQIQSDKIISKIEMFYDKILKKLLEKKSLVFIPIILSILLGFIFLFFIDFELLPKIKSDVYQIKLDFPEGTSIKKLEKIGYDLAFQLKEDEDLSFYAIYGGIESDDYQRLSCVEESFETINVTLKTDKFSENTKKIINQLGLKYNATIEFSEKQDLLNVILNTKGNKSVLSAKSLQELNDKLHSFDVSKIHPLEISKELVFVPDRLSCSRLFTNPSYVASTIRNSLDGIEASTFYKNGRQIPIVVKLAESESITSESVLDLNVKINDLNIPFNFFGKFEYQANEKNLYRFNRKDSKIILDLTKDEFLKNNNQKDLINLSKIETQEMLANGIFLLIVCVLLLYFIMGSQFQSFLIPLLLLIALPPAFSGAIFLLFLFNQTLNIHGVIAFVILFGTSVNNSILLYESCSLIKKVSNNSILTACRKKLRGILVTNITTIFALIPFAFNISGKNSQSSMSLCIIGGLTTSTLIVLTVIPVIFSVVLKRGKNDC